MYALVVLLIQSISILAQSVISGKIIDKNGEPIASTTVLLLNNADSTYITGTASDKDGRFEIPKIRPDNYILSFSMIGFRKIYRQQQVGQNTKNDLGDVVLKLDQLSEFYPCQFNRKYRTDSPAVIQIRCLG